jgi:hypothetical protein
LERAIASEGKIVGLRIDERISSAVRAGGSMDDPMTFPEGATDMLLLDLGAGLCFNTCRRGWRRRLRRRCALQLRTAMPGSE